MAEALSGDFLSRQVTGWEGSGQVWQPHVGCPEQSRQEQVPSGWNQALLTHKIPSMTPSCTLSCTWRVRPLEGVGSPWHHQFPYWELSAAKGLSRLENVSRGRSLCPAPLPLWAPRAWPVGQREATSRGKRNVYFGPCSLPF